MAKKASAKKSASKKKRTAAQKRATQKMIAANKKKAASKKKSSARKKRTTRATPRRRPTTRLRGSGGARRTNPATQWTRATQRYMVRAKDLNTGHYMFMVHGGSGSRDPLNAALFGTKNEAVEVAQEVDGSKFSPVHVIPIDVKMGKKQYMDAMS